MRFVGIVGALVLILALTLPAYAETQSVKVSGDLTIRGIHKREFDLNENARPKSDNFIMSTTEIQIDADLTDNVSTVVRIVNQRNWGDSDRKEVKNYFASKVLNNQIIWEHRLLELGIDLAYIQIKEMFFEPVTLRIGRQDLWFGRGLIIGANQVDPGFISVVLGGAFVGSERGIGSPELTAFNSFDAIRATIDFEKYAPFVVDVVYFKNDEGHIGAEDDVDVYGINMGYTWDIYNAEAESYYWLRHDNSIGNPYFADADQTHTIGVRGSFMPNEEFVFGGEAAYQFGNYVESEFQHHERDRNAYMLNAFVDYLGWTKYLYSPKVGAEWIFTSGDRNVGQGSGKFGSWNAMYRGYFPLLIRPFQGYYYMTSRFPAGDDFGMTNQHEFILSGSLQPLDDVTFEAKFARYFFDEDHVCPTDVNEIGTDDIGSEIDLLTTYDYTEDVTFSLLTAWFFPGEVYEHQRVIAPNALGVLAGVDLQPQVASEVIGTCKVSF